MDDVYEISGVARETPWVGVSVVVTRCHSIAPGAFTCEGRPVQKGRRSGQMGEIMTEGFGPDHGDPEAGGRRGPFYGCPMSLQWEQIVVDASDPVALGRWWATALDWTVVSASAEECEIQPEPGRLPGMIFVPVPEAKAVKNRIHVDLRPDDQAVEVQRFLDLGAVRTSVGEGDVSWVVLADPEGNEFCVLSGRPRAG